MSRGVAFGWLQRVGLRKAELPTSSLLSSDRGSGFFIWHYQASSVRKAL